MAKVKRYIKPEEVELRLAEMRKGLFSNAASEMREVSRMVEQAKTTGKVGDKIIMVLDPRFIHFPKWQRKIDLTIVNNIAQNYDKNKWELPKLIYSKGKLYPCDGQHRVYAAIISANKMGSVPQYITAELITDITEKEAIELFLGQMDDKHKLGYDDIFNAAIYAKKKEYTALREICAKNKLNVKGDEYIENPIGILQPIKECVKMVQHDSETFEHILELIGKLEWNGEMTNRAYNAKVIRVFNKLFAYYCGKEEQVENILLDKCKGSDYFKKEISPRSQSMTFDLLSEIINSNVKKYSFFAQVV